MPMFRSYTIMLQRKLLYTGVTRAKEKLILMGDLASFTYGVKRVNDMRQSVLKDLISEAVLSSEEKAPIKKVKESQRSLKKAVIYIKDPESAFDTLGEVLDDTISPYSFMDE